MPDGPRSELESDLKVDVHSMSSTTSAKAASQSIASSNISGEDVLQPDPFNAQNQPQSTPLASQTFTTSASTPMAYNPSLNPFSHAASQLAGAQFLGDAHAEQIHSLAAKITALTAENHALRQRCARRGIAVRNLERLVARLVRAWKSGAVERERLISAEQEIGGKEEEANESRENEALVLGAEKTLEQMRRERGLEDAEREREREEIRAEIRREVGLEGIRRRREEEKTSGEESANVEVEEEGNDEESI